jgi:uncharacterized protein
VTTFTRPGVYASEVPLPAVAPPTGSSLSIGAVFGKASEGPTEPTYITSWRQFSRLYNLSDVTTAFARGVYQAFANGATNMYVCRVAGASADKAVVPTASQASVPFLVEAKSAGQWGNEISVTYTPSLDTGVPVGAGVTNKALTSNVATLTTSVAHNLEVNDVVTIANVAASFNGSFRVASVPTPTTFTFAKSASDVVSSSVSGGTAVKNSVVWTVDVARTNASTTYYNERFTVLTVDPDQGRYFSNVINDPQSGSAWITALTAVPTAPFDVPVTVTLIDGSDDAPAAADYTDTVETFDLVEGALLMHCTDAAYLGSGDCSTINAAMTNYCTTRGDSFAVLDTPAGLTATEASEFGTVTSSYGAMYYPWVRISNPSREAVAGASLLVPPGSAVTGMILANDRAVGPWQSPAGVSMSLAGTVANNNIGVERLLTADDLDTLNTATNPVNAIRPVTGQGITIMGARTQATGSVDRYIQVRRTMNLLKRDLGVQAEFALFQPITLDLMDNLKEVMSNYLDNLWANGGLAGNAADQAYYVTCDPTNNTSADASQGRLNVDVGVSLLIPAEFIVLRVGQFQGVTTVAETA